MNRTFSKHKFENFFFSINNIEKTVKSFFFAKSIRKISSTGNNVNHLDGIYFIYFLSNSVKITSISLIIYTVHKFMIL